uniref:Putative secreted protein n=1 Tax=Lutzomyia longipalpis TaxID=7200 RepID=A0A1B0GHH1_LUTLO
MYKILAIVGLICSVLIVNLHAKPFDDSMIQTRMLPLPDSSSIIFYSRIPPNYDAAGEIPNFDMFTGVPAFAADSIQVSQPTMTADKNL